MKSKRKSEKKNNSKSLEKKSTSKQHDFNFLVDCELDYCDKSKAFVPDIIEARNR